MARVIPLCSHEKGHTIKAVAFESESNLLQALEVVGCVLSKAKLRNPNLYALALHQCGEARLAELYDNVIAAKMLAHDKEQQIEGIIAELKT